MHFAGLPGIRFVAAIVPIAGPFPFRTRDRREGQG